MGNTTKLNTLFLWARGAHPAAQQVHPLLNEDVIKERKPFFSHNHGGAGCFWGNSRGLMSVLHLKQQEKRCLNPCPVFRVSRVWMSLYFKDESLCSAYNVYLACWFCVRFRVCMLSGLRAQKGTAGGRLSLWGWADVTSASKHTVVYVNKQLRKYILSFHEESWGHANTNTCSHTHTNTHPWIYHSFPYGQTHLKGNGLESDTEQFLTPCLSHHVCTVCVRTCSYVCNTILCVDKMTDQSNIATSKRQTLGTESVADFHGAFP